MGSALWRRGTTVAGWIFSLACGLLGLLGLAVGEASGRRVVVFLVVLALATAPPTVRQVRGRLRAYGLPGLPLLSGLCLGTAAMILVPGLPAIPRAPNRLSEGAPRLASKLEAANPAASERHPTFSIVGRHSSMGGAQEALNEGDVDRAIQLFFNRPVTPEDRSSAPGRKLLAAIQAASNRQTGRNVSAEAAERFTSYWQPQLANLPHSMPDDATALWARVNAFEEFARALEEQPASALRGEAVRHRAAFKDQLVKRQRSDFPLLRKGYQDIAGAAMFRLNIIVRVSGTANRALSLLGPLFADNANIEDVHRSVRANVSKLRLSTVSYRWMRGAPGFTYDVEGPSDADVGYWRDGTFMRVN